MNSYIDYTYYTETFGGTLVPQNDFDKLSKQASQEVKIRILGRDITDYETEVKDCTCYVLELIYNQEQLKNKYNDVLLGADKIITSEKVGDYSRNIANLNVNEFKEIVSNTNQEEEITNLIETHLLFTGLTYRGL